MCGLLCLHSPAAKWLRHLTIMQCEQDQKDSCLSSKCQQQPTQTLPTRTKLEAEEMDFHFKLSFS